MRTVSGKLFHTRMGKMLVYNEQDERFSLGEKVFYDGLPYIIKHIVFPSKPEAKYSMEIVLDYDSPHYCRVYKKEIGDAW